MQGFLIAEYCRGPFYMGWHLYLRENMAFNRRNRDGGWGWIRRPAEDFDVIKCLWSLGIIITGDGTCDYDGIAEIVRRYPIKGRKCGGKPRGRVSVDISESLPRRIINIVSLGKGQNAENKKE